MNKDDAINEFYWEMIKKNIGVYTEEQQNKLRNSKVIILGLGGVGGMEAVLCARSGIGHISGVDPDYFEPSNSNRQMLATTSTMNEYKSIATERHLREINPFLNTSFYNLRVTEENVMQLIAGHDLVLEALDDMPSRIIAHRAARALGIPSISMSGSPPHRGFVSSFFPAGIAYEEALNLKTQSKSMADPQVIDLVNDLKKHRAQHSVTHGAPQAWADDFCSGKAGWIITSIRATLIAAFSVHEALQILIGATPLARAPKGIIIDMNDLNTPVKVVNPQSGFWEAGEI